MAIVPLVRSWLLPRPQLQLRVLHLRVNGLVCSVSLAVESAVSSASSLRLHSPSMQSLLDPPLRGRSRVSSLQTCRLLMHSFAYWFRWRLLNRSHSLQVKILRELVIAIFPPEASRKPQATVKRLLTLNCSRAGEAWVLRYCPLFSCAAVVVSSASCQLYSSGHSTDDDSFCFSVCPQQTKPQPTRNPPTPTLTPGPFDRASDRP